MIPDPVDPLLPLWRAIAVFRVVALAFAAGAVAVRGDDLESLAGAVALLAVMAAWTLVVVLGYGLGWGRTRRFVVVDLVVTLGCMAGSLMAQPWDAAAGGATVLTSIWVAGPVLALGLVWGHAGGLVGAACVSAALLLLRRPPGSEELYAIALLVVVGLVFGYAARVMRETAERLRRALAAEGAALERERLQRSIHDGVLQVLTLVRRGGDRDADSAALAQLAAEQEVALRALLTSDDSALDAQERDLTGPMRALARHWAEVVTPSEPIVLPGPVVDELVAATREALSNVERHAGPGARAWVVLEDHGDAVGVVVRDDGRGIAPGRLDAAREAGHLGASQSIRGRIEAMGGRAVLTTAPGEGVEWEMIVPKQGVA